MAKEEAVTIMLRQGMREMVRERGLDSKALHICTSSMAITQRCRPALLTRKERVQPGHSFPHLHHMTLCAHRHTHTHALHVLTHTCARTYIYASQPRPNSRKARGVPT